MSPTKTGAAAAVGLVLPELKGKLDGFAVRVPTINVSMVDLSFVAERDTDVDEVNQILREAAEGQLKGVLERSEERRVGKECGEGWGADEERGDVRGEWYRESG